MSFAHLHIHSHYSMNESIVKIPELFARAAELGLAGLALTDSSRMGGVQEFMSVARDFPSVKPVVGASFRIVDDVYPVVGERPQFKVLLLAKNLTGYRNLMKLSSIACVNGTGRPTAVRRAYLEAYHEDLICLSGGLFGEVSQTLIDFGEARAREVALEYKELFGEDFYFEVSLHKRPRQLYVKNIAKRHHVSRYIDELYALEDKLLTSLMNLGEELGIKLVATNPVYYLNADDALAYDAHLCFLNGKNIADENGPEFTRLEYLRSEEEMRSQFVRCPEAVENTMAILSKIESYRVDVVEIGLPGVSANPKQELRDEIYKGASARYGSVTEEIKDRIEGELNTIAKTNFEAYFLIIKEMIDWARVHHCVVGPGRGRAVSSMVCYCLGITEVDPLRYGLLSESFLNPDRIPLPDIDIDINDEGRQPVVDHLTRKYGREVVSYLATYAWISMVSALREVTVAFGLSRNQVQRIKDYLFYYDGDEPTKELKDACDCAKKLNGVICQTGTHVCGILLSDDAMTNKIPLMSGAHCPDGGFIPISQYDGHWVENAGVLKIDLIGTKWLDFIREVERTVSQKYGVPVDSRKAPLDDAATYALYQSGDTDGVFLFDDEEMQKWLKRIRPDRFSDLVAMKALFHPEIRDKINYFNALKNGIETMTYSFPEEKEILAETYGLILYEEQVMMLGQKIAGMTPGQTAAFKRFSPRFTAECYQDFFMDCGLRQGRPEKDLQNLLQRILLCHDKVFMKSHAVAYAWMSYQTAWLKAHYREEFMAIKGHSFFC